jgi:hypothetical protein
MRRQPYQPHQVIAHAKPAPNYNLLMDGMLQPAPSDRAPEWRPKLLGIAAILIVAAAVVFLQLPKPHPPVPVNPYATQLKISGIQLSAAQNFIGAKVTYIDGTITNPGNKTVTSATVHVTFRDPYGQVAQIDDVPVKILQTTGPYPDTSDLAASPLTPGKSQPFRLIFDHVSEQWNQSYPDLQIVNVTMK